MNCHIVFPFKPERGGITDQTNLCSQKTDAKTARDVTDAKTAITTMNHDIWEIV